MFFEGYLLFFSLVVFLPARTRLTYSWNLGRFLGIVLFMQILRGVGLTWYYTWALPFESVQVCIRETNYGWFLRILHFNGASFLFFLFYLHILKGIFFYSYRLSGVWFSGLLLYFGFIGVAFLGYTLVWGQMRYWAAVVITRLLREIPYVGGILIYWVWGGFFVSLNTLSFFFTLHFILPFLLLLVVFTHLIFLHISGRSSPLFTHRGQEKTSFYPYFWWKDSINIVWLLLFFFFICVFPYSLGDPELHIEAAPSVSPVHIVPEWYFLWVYAILRAIPNKSLGVLALLRALLVWRIFPLFISYFSPVHSLCKYFVLILSGSLCFLRFLGQCPVEFPYVILRQEFSFLFFFIVFLLNFRNWVWGYLWD